MAAKKNSAYNQIREQGFNTGAFQCKLNEYNALHDPNMQHYFENKKVQSLLYQTGQIDRHGRIIDVKKNIGKIKILEREFSQAEKVEDRRRNEEMEMRVRNKKKYLVFNFISFLLKCLFLYFLSQYRIQKKRFTELENKRKEEILHKLKVDHELSKEILTIMRNSNPSTAKSTANSRPDTFSRPNTFNTEKLVG
jgi:hypothetical protein